MAAGADVSSQPVLLDKLDAGVLTLTLNRPERLNALNGALVEALSAAVGRATAEPECRAVLITGAGRGFCAGADLADSRVCSRRRPPRSRPIARQGPQSAHPRDSQSAEAGRLRGQRSGGGGWRQSRARLRHRARGEISSVPAGFRAHRPHSGRRRHFHPAPPHWRCARPGADDAGRTDRRRSRPRPRA